MSLGCVWDEFGMSLDVCWVEFGMSLGCVWDEFIVSFDHLSIQFCGNLQKIGPHDGLYNESASRNSEDFVSCRSCFPLGWGGWTYLLF